VTNSRSVQALVLGGGITGLTAARDLAKHFESVLVLESSDQLGGSIGAVTIAGQSVDSGAEAFAVSRDDAVLLIESLGLMDDLVVPSRADARIRTGEEAYLIPYGILGIPSNLDDPAVLAAVGADALSEARELDSLSWNITRPISIGHLVRKRLGNAFADRLLAPVVGGVHAANPDSLDADAIAPGLVSSAEKAGSLTAAVARMRAAAAVSRPGGAIMSLRGGMHSLIDALVRDLEQSGVSILLSASAASATYDAGAWRVTTEGGDEYSSEVLVVALPARAAAQLFAADRLLNEPLSQVQTVDVAIVILAIRGAPELDTAPLGSGVLISAGTEGIEAKASTHATAKWEWLAQRSGGIHILRFSYGRDGHLPSDLAGLPEQALADAKKLYGLISPEVIAAKTILWPASLVHSGTGHLEVAERVNDEVSKRINLEIIGAGLGGNGITGAIRQAQEAVSRLIVRYFRGD
jgi:oxygen-dependent protoporphyrinogen oxidase